MGDEAERLVKKLASKMEYHTGQRYSDTVGYIVVFLKEGLSFRNP